MTSVIKIAATNDFDSKECIVPITFGSSDVKIHSRDAHTKDSKVSEKPREQTSQVIRISLADCIQCSGCITSAEEVFIQDANASQLEKILLDKSTPYIIMVSTPSLLSLR